MSIRMSDILDNAPRTQEEPKLIVRRVSHAPVWSVWATLEGAHSEEIFEGSTEEEASNWINSAGQVWLEERRRKRNSLPDQTAQERVRGRSAAAKFNCRFFFLLCANSVPGILISLRNRFLALGYQKVKICYCPANPRRGAGSPPHP